MSPSVNQETCFNEVKYLIHFALDGNNVCIMAYGATGSGKTYTIVGNTFDEFNSNPDILEQNNPENQNYINYFSKRNFESVGILPRSVIEIFTKLLEFEGVNANYFNFSDSSSDIINEEIFFKNLSQYYIECFFFCNLNIYFLFFLRFND
jgi:hypothetical protein